MNVGRAISYVTEDPDWVRKVLIGGAIMLVSSIGMFLVVGIIGFFLLLGYALEIVRRVYYGVDTPLPEWTDIGEYILSGLILTGGIMLWTMPFAVLMAVGITISAMQSPAGGTAAALASFLLVPPLLVAVSVFIVPILIGRYAVKRQFAAMFDLRELLAEARRAFVPSLILAVGAVIASTVAQFGVVAFFIGVFVTSWYAYLVIAHLTGQVYREARRSDGLATEF